MLYDLSGLSGGLDSHDTDTADVTLTFTSFPTFGHPPRRISQQPLARTSGKFLQY